MYTSCMRNISLIPQKTRQLTLIYYLYKYSSSQAPCPMRTMAYRQSKQLSTHVVTILYNLRVEYIICTSFYNVAINVKQSTINTVYKKQGCSKARPKLIWIITICILHAHFHITMEVLLSKVNKMYKNTQCLSIN